MVCLTKKEGKKMDLFERMTNISGISIEEKIQVSIINVKKTLNNLTEERTCKIYSSYLYQELLRNHIPCKVVNTLDLGFSYEHHFVLIPNTNTYYLADLTFSQFPYQENLLSSLLKNGYQEISDMEFNAYLLAVLGSLYQEPILLEDAYFGSSALKK